MRGPTIALGALLAVLATAGLTCLTPMVKNGAFENEHVRYSVGEPGAGWITMRLQTANVAWFHEALDASMLVNSHCEGVADSSLESLTNDLLLGTTDREIVSQVRVTSSGRDALDTRARARVDGVPRSMALFVVKKDGCVYDIVLAAPDAAFAEASAAFARVRDGFEIGPRKDHP